MRPHKLLALSSLSLLVASCQSANISKNDMKEKTVQTVLPPVAKTIDKVDTVHGDLRKDPYFWLREKESPEVITYLNAENAYTDSVLKETEPFQEALYKEMLARIKETDLSAPYRYGEYFYYSRTEKGKQYSIYCRKKGSLDSAEEIILDLNELGKGLKFISLGEFDVSDDGNLLAYSLDTTGFRQYKMQIKDLRSGTTLPDTAEKVASLTWASDNQTLFYTVEEPETKRHYRLYRHVLGSVNDELVFEEKDQRFELGATRSRSKKFIFLEVGSHTTSEFRFLPADQPNGSWTLIAVREQDHEYDLDHHGDFFYIRTNDRGRSFRVVKAPVTNPAKTNWKEIIPHRPEIMIEDVNCFTNHLVISERENGLPQLRIDDLQSGTSHRVQMPEPAFTASLGTNAEFETAILRFNYQSFVTPNSVFDYDMDTRQRTLVKQNEVLGGYDATQYQSERIHATANDGTKVPISLVYKKGLSRNGKNPTLLYGYGSYGIPMPIGFSSNRLSLLDRGFVYAIAHIRGGGEMGKTWHDQGRMQQKMNTFTDFIRCAEHLIAEKYTSKEHLAIMGGSAGGLLMGTVANLRPDLFKLVISQVPFVDVINTMLDESLPLTVGEFEEWGNPKVQAEYAYMKKYCPYTNLEAKNYPTMLVKTSLNDSQVMYWEPAKYVAKLRTLKKDKNLLLFKCNMAAGHGGASGRYDFLKEIALDYAFLLTQFGVQQ